MTEKMNLAIADDLMTLEELGKHIQQLREEKNYTLDDVAAQIKVSSRTLQAIEAGTIDGLPHAVYSKGFIRSFALVVGMDQTTINNHLERIFPPEVFEDAREPVRQQHYPVPGQGKRILALLLLLALLGGILAGGWYVAVNYGDFIIEKIRQPFSAVTPSASQATFSVASATLLPDMEPEPAVPASPAQTQVPVDTEPMPDLEIAETAATDSPAQAGVVDSSDVQPARANSPHTVVVQAQEECYLGITKDSAVETHYTVYPNGSYTIDFQHTLALVVGNAGGVTVSYNGKDMGSLGSKKQRRKLLFP